MSTAMQTSGTDQGVQTKARPTPGLGIAFILGSAATLSALVFAVPGRGGNVALTWSAGLIAAFVAPGLRGLLAVVAGAAGTATIVDLSDGAFNLVFLIAAATAVLAAHGTLVGSVVRRIRLLGTRASLRDVGVLSGAGLALATTLVFVWFAVELVANPP